MTADVSDPESVADLARRVSEQAGDVWLLVNNAGVYMSAPFTEMPLNQWEHVIGVNLWGVVHCMHAFLPGMVSRDSGYVVMQPDEAAGILFAGIAEQRFWILTHPEQSAPAIRGRADDIALGRNPGEESVDPNFRKATARTPS